MLFDRDNLYFHLSQNITAVPTIRLSPDFSGYVVAGGVLNVKSGDITRLHYYMNPTAVETYTLRLWNTGDNYPFPPIPMGLLSNLLYETAAGKADSTRYEETLPNGKIPFWLYRKDYLYVSVEWTGPPGVTTGYVEVSGTSRDMPLSPNDK
jgi:hypothetical protein